MSVLDEDIESLKRRTSELLEQQRDNEAAFAQQRAKFMELFKQKEGFRSKMFAVMLDLNCSFFISVCYLFATPRVINMFC